MDERLHQLIWTRAKGHCEYCQLSQDYDLFPFQIDHIIAQKHHGLTEESNLGLSCFNCNIHKGSNIAGMDSQTGGITRLFHPRTDQWEEHFEWNAATLQAKTAIG